MYCTLIIGTAYKVTSCEETKIYIFSATNLPCLVNVVCERPFPFCPMKTSFREELTIYF